MARQTFSRTPTGATYSCLIAMGAACSSAGETTGATAAATGVLDGKSVVVPLNATAQIATPVATSAQANADKRRCGTAGAAIGLLGRTMWTMRRACGMAVLTANRARSRLPHR